jgi:diacylglycerol kinase (ATP)
VGMWGAPGAELDDGLLDVIAVGDLSRFQALLHLRTIYRGDHLDLARVNRHRAREVVARVVRPRDVCLLDVDGEQLGRLPAIWNVHRRAVRLKV